MQIRKLILSVLMVNPLAANAVDNEWHQYSLTQFPSGGRTCEQVADDLGKRFESSTGLSVFRSSCEKQTAAGYDISITYAGLTVAPLVSTLKEEGGIGSLGVYRTLAECQTGLVDEARIFAEETKLTPFVNYCYKGSPLDKTPFAARIDAFGTPARTPHRFEHTVYASSIPDAARVLKSTLTASKSSGVRVHQAAFAHDGSSKLVIRYYSTAQEKPFHWRYFRAHEAAKYSALGTRTPYEACLAQLAEAEKGFSSAYKTAGIWFCAWDNLLFQATLSLLRVQAREGLKTDTAPDRYATFAQCDSQRPVMNEWYRKKLGQEPVAVLCSWKSGLGTGKPDAFVLKILTKLPELEPSGLTDPDFGFPVSISRSTP